MPEEFMNNPKNDKNEEKSSLLNRAASFINNNSDDLKTIAPIIAAGIPAAIGIGKGIMRWRSNKEERDRRECWFYDARNHRYSHSKRPLKPHERIEMDIRYSNGESYDAILHSMRLLK
jgi:hypothetical protein